MGYLYITVKLGVAKAVSNASRNREKKFHLWGWVLFLICATFFIASSIAGDDILGLSGSIIFLIGCVLFLVPLVIKKHEDEDS